MPTENTIRKSRMDYIDIYRAFGIILMVMGHIGFGGKFDKFIHAFHMPMFFFISGFFYKEKCLDIKKYAVDKAKKLLTPYFVFGGGVLLPLVPEQWLFSRTVDALVAD